MAAELVGQVKGRKVQWDSDTEEVLLEAPDSAGTKFVSIGKSRNKLDAINRAKRTIG